MNISSENSQPGGRDRNPILRIICDEFGVRNKEKVLWEYRGRTA